MKKDIKIEIAGVCISISIDNRKKRDLCLKKCARFLTHKKPDFFIKIKHKKCRKIKQYRFSISKTSYTFIENKTGGIFYRNYGGEIAVLRMDARTNAFDVTMPEKYIFPIAMIITMILFLKGVISIHACGLKYNSGGFLFAGESGRGKTTIANLCGPGYKRVINDERILIKKSKKGFKLYSMLFFGHDKKLPFFGKTAFLKKIFFIEHAKKNYASQETKHTSFIKLIKSCFFLNLKYNNISKKNFAALAVIARKIPCYRLCFTRKSKIFKNTGSFIYE